MTPERVDPWVSIFRDCVIVILASFMLVYETVVAHEPNPYIVGAALTLIGVPPALRLDVRRKRSSGAEAESRPDTPSVDPYR